MTKNYAKRLVFYFVRRKNLRITIQFLYLKRFMNNIRINKWWWFELTNTVVS